MLKPGHEGCRWEEWIPCHKAETPDRLFGILLMYTPMARDEMYAWERIRTQEKNDVRCGSCDAFIPRSSRTTMRLTLNMELAPKTRFLPRDELERCIGRSVIHHNQCVVRKKLGAKRAKHREKRRRSIPCGNNDADIECVFHGAGFSRWERRSTARFRGVRTPNIQSAAR